MVLLFISWMIDVAVQKCLHILHKFAGKLIHRAFKENIAWTYLARYYLSLKRTMQMFLSHSNGKKSCE